MYAAIRRYAFDPKDSEEVDQRIGRDFVPQLRAAGFVAYYWLNQGDGVGASITVFEDEASAERSVHLAANFAQSHLPMLGIPEVTRGEVKAYSLGTAPG